MPGSTPSQPSEKITTTARRPPHAAPSESIEGVQRVAEPGAAGPVRDGSPAAASARSASGGPKPRVIRVQPGEMVNTSTAETEARTQRPASGVTTTCANRIKGVRVRRHRKPEQRNQQHQPGGAAARGAPAAAHAPRRGCAARPAGCGRVPGRPARPAADAARTGAAAARPRSSGAGRARLLSLARGQLGQARCRNTLGRAGRHPQPVTSGPSVGSRPAPARPG